MAESDGHDVWVCRCEEVARGDLERAIDEGAHSLNDVKRRTRAGMGVCQGIFCLSNVAAMIHDRAGIPLAELLPMTPRPPTRLILLSSLADMKEEADAGGIATIGDARSPDGQGVGIP